MNTTPSLERLLVWYPRRWRERYGDELVALMEDQLGGAEPTTRFRAGIAWQGLRQRWRGGGLVGATRSENERRTSGVLLVFCAWVGIVLAGANFAKLSEHYAAWMPPVDRSAAEAAFVTLQVLAGVGALVALAGVALAVPALARFLLEGGWSAVRGQVMAACVATVVAIGLSLALVVWSHQLAVAQRNGSDVPYSATFLVWFLVGCLAAVLWTAASIKIARKLDLGQQTLHLQSLLAMVLAVIMAMITAAVCVWWALMSTEASGFLRPDTPRLAASVAIMALSVVLAGWGVHRLAVSRLAQLR